MIRMLVSSGIIADRQFWNKGLDEVENLLAETTALAKKMGKIKGK